MWVCGLYFLEHSTQRLRKEKKRKKRKMKRVNVGKKKHKESFGPIPFCLLIWVQFSQQSVLQCWYLISSPSLQMAASSSPSSALFNKEASNTDTKLSWKKWQFNITMVMDHLLNNHLSCIFTEVHIYLQNRYWIKQWLLVFLDFWNIHVACFTPNRAFKLFIF